MTDSEKMMAEIRELLKQILDEIRAGKKKDAGSPDSPYPWYPPYPYTPPQPWNPPYVTWCARG